MGIHWKMCNEAKQTKDCLPMECIIFWPQRHRTAATINMYMVFPTKTKSKEKQAELE